jgi:class 3 adenylate cyclase/tetratricopeptide (TPR) repeat protein
MKFCGECGSSMTTTAAKSGAPQDRQEPVEERRLVSVLFADLVGFTALSESRDHEDVRDLLSRYFDTCTTLIGRYGGTVEKFIGDAVMAVWGSPVATEDDAERAVRAALDLVSGVADFGADVGAAQLKARAGVLTGEAAVSVGAKSEGMVIGDMVNTASRIQSVAEPGAVLVGDSTRRATDAAIAYEDAGTHELKGKAEPLKLWRAVRVTGGAPGGASGLEAPFVGRERELRLVKETFHASADERRAHLVSVIGVAGIGKSRLAWEFEKYIAGLAQEVFWHRGRCPSYGEGLTYWALAEMVRMRCRIREEETGPSASQKLRATIADVIADPEERGWVEPRLAHLLGLAGGEREREELFSAWRLFFERLADRDPTVLVFEDIQWADRSLLDFIEYLLEWARSSRLFILTLGRPELAERRTDWGAGQRNFISIHLEPLSQGNMQEMLSGLVPGLPDEVGRSILDRAQGIPFYSVETVRMLLDRGFLVGDGTSYRPLVDIESLEIPETLHALVAARLDGLDPLERKVAQDGAVLGRSFFKEGAAAVSGMPADEVERILSQLVRKEILALQSDPWSPERGQYSFLQDLVRQIAYNTIAKKERKAKHLAAAGYLLESWVGDADEIVEVVAAHYLQAFDLDPDASDAPIIKARALEMLKRAGERAASLGANYEAQHYYERAAEMVDDTLARATLVERAGEMALSGDRLEDAELLLTGALASFEDASRTHDAARVSARLAEVDWAEGRLDVAIDRMDRAFKVLSDEPDEGLAMLAAQLGRLLYFRGQYDLCEDRLDTALRIAETIVDPEVISHALTTKGAVAMNRTRPQEGEALTRHALKVALDNERMSAALRAYNNLAENAHQMDRYELSLDLYQQGLALARKAGDRFWHDLLLAENPIPLFMLGRWNEVFQVLEELDLERALPDVLAIPTVVPIIHVSRGDLASAERILNLHSRYETSSDQQERLIWATGKAVYLNAAGAHAEALPFAEEALSSADLWGGNTMMVKVGLSEAVDASLALGDLGRASKILDIGQALPVRTSPVVHALLQRSKARLAAAAGNGQDEESLFKEAAGIFRDTSVPFWLATTLVELGEWLRSRGRAQEAAPLLHEAGGIFDGLGATAWLARLHDQASST